MELQGLRRGTGICAETETTPGLLLTPVPEPERMAPRPRSSPLGDPDSPGSAPGRPGSESGFARPACILGMHRSGTSLVAGLLRICGVDLGPSDRLMEPKSDNPGGFWEHLDIYELNEEILASVDASWDEPETLLPGWEESPALEPCYGRARRIIERDFGSSQWWAWKDPRTAVLLPFWKKVVPDLRFIVCVRNPLDVARSLSLRDSISISKGTKLWALYTAAGIVYSRGTDRIITLTENYFRTWREELDTLKRFLNLPPERVEPLARELESFIDREQWHHRSTETEVLLSSEVSPSCKLLYRSILHSLNTRGKRHFSSEADADLDLDLVSELIWTNRTAVSKVRGELKEARASLDDTQDRLFEQATRAANLERWLEERDADIDRQKLEISKLKSSLAESGAVVDAVTSSLGWQLLNRYRDLKEHILFTGRLPERLYRVLIEKWRRRLSKRTVLTSLTGFVPSPAPTELPSFHDPVDVPTKVVDPPQGWTEDPERPPVVIIIPHWNRVRYLRQCVNSIFEETRYRRSRVCVFDQGSTDGSKEYLQSLGDRIETILSPHNVGFVHACNITVRAFPKWDVVFLNNDTRVTKSWLTSLVETAYKSDNIGLVGAKLIYPDGRLQEAGSQIFRDGSARAFGKFEDLGDPEFNQRREVDYCSASCLFVKREVLDECGPFEECYSPSYYEDADLAFKARATGYKTLYEPNATVIHQEYGTLGKSSALGWMERNQEKFVERWAPVLDEQPPSLWQAPSTGRKSLLFIGDIVPAPDRSAGGARLYHLLRILAKHYDVAYAYLKDQMIHDYIRPLEQFGVSTFYPGYAKSVDSYELDLKSILSHNSFDAVICSLFTIGTQFLGLIRQRSPRSAVLIDTYDVHYLRELREAEIKQDQSLVEKAKKTKETELSVYSRADVVIAVTEEDKRALLQEQPSLNVEVIPTVHQIPAEPRPHDRRRDLLFVGGFSHQPNTDAVLYFSHEIFPLVRERLPDMRLHVVGNSPSAEVLALNGDGILVTGYVPDLRSYLESALASVAPIRFGSGMKGKIAEAMAHGLPVVTTSVGAEGMDLRDGQDAMIADSAVGFADRIVSLHTDADLWTKISRNARSRVSREWTPDVVEDRLVELFDTLDGAD